MLKIIFCERWRSLTFLSSFIESARGRGTAWLHQSPHRLRHLGAAHKDSRKSAHSSFFDFCGVVSWGSWKIRIVKIFERRKFLRERHERVVVWIFVCFLQAGRSSTRIYFINIWWEILILFQRFMFHQNISINFVSSSHSRQRRNDSDICDARREKLCDDNKFELHSDHVNTLVINWN